MLLFVCIRARLRACVCRSQVHFTPRAPLPRKPFQFYVFYWTRILACSRSFALSLSLSHSLSYNSRLFVFAVCPAVCLDFIFMATAQIHRQHLRRINWEARTLQFICIYFIYFHLLYNSRIFFTHSTLLSYSFFALFASSSALPLRLISLAQTGKSR